MIVDLASSEEYAQDGYRMIAAVTSRRLGRAVNAKRVLRVMRKHGVIQRRRVEPRPKRPGYFVVRRPDELWHTARTAPVSSQRHRPDTLGGLLHECGTVAAWRIELSVPFRGSTPDMRPENRRSFVTTLRDRKDVEDFLMGANFMSASGGGDPAIERGLLYEDLDQGLELGWNPLDETSDALFCTACFSGSIAPEAFEEPPEAKVLAPAGKLHRPLVEAVLELQNYLGKPIGGLVSIEIGASNTGSILDVAANLRLPLVDGDYAGRAIPELHATVLHLFGVDVLPQALVDEYGNRLIMRAAVSDAFNERLGKFLALASFGSICVALAALPAKEVASIYVPGTLTECLELGRAIRLAREEDVDPVGAAAEAIGGWALFRGTIARREWTNTGYMEGTEEIAGEGEFAGRSLRIWFKNENHVTWLDERPYVCSPDLIEVCDAETAEPLVNTFLKEGDRVAVVGGRRRDAYDSEAGLAALGPRHFGWDLDFTPIETLVAAGD